jgi:hypothetical protein
VDNGSDGIEAIDTAKPEPLLQALTAAGATWRPVSAVAPQDPVAPPDPVTLQDPVTPPDEEIAGDPGPL